jgi:hypothetical protein
MAGCNIEKWSLEELNSALQDKHKDNKKIVVPMFQRGLRWDKDRKKTFIDSLEKGYPVGTMLFYEQNEDSGRSYILVDGLQRSNCIRGYINNPAEYLSVTSISDDCCKRILSALHREGQSSDYINIRKIVLDFIKRQQTYKNLQYFEVAENIVKFFESDYESIHMLIDIFKDFFLELQSRYDTIASAIIPVIVYTGDSTNLPEIFDRINSKGTPLDQYEVYAASWPVEKKFKINNSDIIEHVINKYETFIDEDYIVHGYNKDTLRNEHMVNAFEYLFGLSRYLAKKYNELNFHEKLQSDEVNPMAFELVNACLNDSNKISVLYNQIYAIDVIKFEKSLESVIDFVISAISPVIHFKSNKHNGKNKNHHSKFQIMSMISTTFKEMYKSGDYTHVADDWTDKKNKLLRNLLQYYIYDILTDWWSEGGTGKIFAVAKPNKYMSDISAQAWAVALNSYFEKTMQRIESDKVASPKGEDYILLNTIYMNVFTAKDQLSIDNFDVEHIAPKKQMQNLIRACKKQGEGLPISSIANLCYLPEAANRSKKELNFYQDKKYLKYVNLDEIENKYSFTSQEDLDWMDMPYDGPNDFSFLKDEYTKYLRNRFETMKKMFCESLKIEMVDIDTQEFEESKQEDHVLTPDILNMKRDLPSPFLKHFVEVTGKQLLRIKGNTLQSLDGNEGYYISVSKDYHQGERSKYWFGYHKNHLWDNCEHKFYMFGCEQTNNLIVMPLEFLESFLDNFNISTDEDGEINHWHIVIFKDKDDRYTLMLSKPEIREIDITKYLLQGKETNE